MIFQFVPGDLIEVPEIPFKEEVDLEVSETALPIVDMQNDFVRAPDLVSVCRRGH